jgi:hypothetical protein
VPAAAHIEELVISADLASISISASISLRAVLALGTEVMVEGGLEP